MYLKYTKGQVCWLQNSSSFLSVGGSRDHRILFLNNGALPVYGSIYLPQNRAGGPGIRSSLHVEVLDLT